MKFQHLGAQKTGSLGEKQVKEYPIHVSNVLLVDPEIGRGVRVRYAFNEEGKRVRVSVKTGSQIDKPQRPELTYRKRNESKLDGMKDTPPSSVLEQTYYGEDFAALDAEFESWKAQQTEDMKGLVFDR